MSPRVPIRLLAAQSDQRLAALVRDGHERAFEALVHRYRRPLLRYCRRMGLSDARAEDVLQQALLKCWLALAGGSQVRELKPWLYRIVHNAAVNVLRGASERAHGELTDALQATAVVAGESDLERHLAVRDALGEVAALPRMQSQAIFLTAVDGQSHDEVASALGISHGALRGLLYRARSTLRSAAAALTPPQLLAWASGGAGAGRPTAERLAELTAGAGGAGMAGVLFKGAVVAVTAGALASGASVVERTQQGGHVGSAAAASGSASTGRVSGDPGGPAAIAAAGRIGAGPGAKGVARRARPTATGGPRAHRERRGSDDANRRAADSGGGSGRTDTQHGSGGDLRVSDGGGGSSGSGGGGSSGGSGGGTSSETSAGSTQASSDGSGGDGSTLSATDSSGPGGGDSSSSGAGSGEPIASEGVTSGDQTSTFTYESTANGNG